MSIFTILDFETTGLKPTSEKITQIAAIKMEIEGDLFLPNSNVINVTEFETLVNPEVEISQFITELTGIDNEKVKDAPTEAEAIKQFVDFLGDSIVVAQHAPFDLGFLYHAALRASLEPKTYNFYCTRTMSAVLFPSISHKLVDMVKLFDISLPEAHNAIYDTNATLNLFAKLNPIAHSFGINFLNKIVYHPDRVNDFDPPNKIAITLQKGKK